MPDPTRDAAAISEAGRKAMGAILAMIGEDGITVSDIGQAVIDREHEMRTFLVRSDPSFRLEHGRIAAVELAKVIFKPLQAKLDADHPPTVFGRVTVADEAYNDLATALSAWFEAELRARVVLGN